jgi:vesicle coat complex subunit
MLLAATQFLSFVSIFMLLYPRGYDMTSNITYSYPYSTHKRYPFSVCENLLCLTQHSVVYQDESRSVNLQHLSSALDPGFAHLTAAMAPDGRMYNASGKKGELFELRQSLNAIEAKERRTAVKRVVASMTLGKDVSSLFPDVIKNAMTTNLAMKKLCYLYIINYARSNPDLIILVINTFVKDAADPNPLIRALSIRTMALIRLEKITEYLVDPLHKSLRDQDPYVRKTAAVCVAKLYDFDPTLVRDQGFIPVLQDLLADGNPMTVANAVAALAEIADASNTPDLLSLTPTTVPRYLAALSECTEWGQVFILDAISGYAPNDSQEAHLIIERIIPRMQHANPSVVIAAVRIIVALMPRLDTDDQRTYLIAKMRAPLISLLSAPPEMQFVALRNINLLLRQHPSLFADDAAVFYASYADPLYVKVERLDILVRLASDSNARQILAELKEYTCEVDTTFVRKAIAAIGRVAIRLPSVAPSCVEVLDQLLGTNNAHVVEEVAVVLQDVLRAYPNQFDAIIESLCKVSESISEPFARAALVWIVGEHADKIYDAPAIIEIFVETVREETPIIQLQILSAAVKTYLQCGQAVQSSAERALQFATTETDNADVRERGIVYQRMLDSDVQAARRIILAAKPGICDTQYDMNPALHKELVGCLGSIAAVYHQPVSLFHGVLDRSPEGGFALSAQPEEDLLGLDETSSGASAAVPAITDGKSAESSPPAGGNGSGFSIDDFLGTSGPGITTATTAASSVETRSEQHTSGGGDLMGDLFGPTPATEPGVARYVSGRDGKILLQADKGKGLVVRGGLAYHSGGSVGLDFELKNQSTSPMSGFAIQLNKNAFGFVPAHGMSVSEPLAPGATTRTTVILAPSGDPDIEKGVMLQIAFKFSPGGVVYFMEKVADSLDSVLIERGGVMEKTAYLATWASTPDEQEVTHELSIGAHLSSVDSIVRALSSSRIFLVAKRTMGGCFILYLSALVVGPLGCVVMAELTLPASTGGPPKLASRSPIGAIAGPFLNAFGATVQRILQ